jgi:heme-degrading monooxygenase HmoA
VYVRVWHYEVYPGAVQDFLVAYGEDGVWVELFVRSPGYRGTELFRSTSAPTHFITVDQWVNRADWEAFLADWGPAYAALDSELEPLTVREQDLGPPS